MRTIEKKKYTVPECFELKGEDVSLLGTSGSGSRGVTLGLNFQRYGSETIDDDDGFQGTEGTDYDTQGGW
jgi:hypothetical protein